LYFAIYLVYFQFKKPLKFTSKLLANVHIGRASWYFKKIHKIPLPWGHPIPVGPGAAQTYAPEFNIVWLVIEVVALLLRKFYSVILS
jgi:hypothetical protein